MSDAEQPERPCWASLQPSLLDCVFRQLSSADLASCSAACTSWRACLIGPAATGAPWEAALCLEWGQAPLCHESRPFARALLIAARTSSLFLSGSACALLPGLPGRRFTSPEQLLLVDPEGSSGHAAADDGDNQGDGDAEPEQTAHRLALASAVPRSGLASSVSVRTVAAGADFAVLLTWDGRVLDTRCAHGSAARGGLGWQGLWRPPGGAVACVSAGGCWQGSGRPGGHVLVVTDRHTVWAWGGNSAGQLGLWSSANGGSSASSDEGAALGVPAAAAAAAAAGAAAGAVGGPAVARGPETLPSWVAAPLEVVDSELAAAMGQPVAAACGEEHSVLLCRQDGRLFAAGSNASGACGLPIVQLAAAAFSAVPLPAGETAAAVACGGRNTAAVTAGGRLLACGANEWGQAGVGRAGGAVWLLTDVGPSAAWHGMQRANQASGGGGGDAAAAVVGVAVGGGSLYALTDAGEAFSWGQSGQGELALGGNSKNVATPSRMPWAHGAAGLAASCGGRFGALLDSNGRLFTFGAGKTGALGHGDTSKRAVGRQVKALAGQVVHSVACGSDWMIAVCGWRAPAGRAGKGGSGRALPCRAGAGATQPGSPGGNSPRWPAAQGEAESPSAAAGGSAGFFYREVDPGLPSPLSPRQRRGLDARARRAGAALTLSTSSALQPDSVPSTPRSAGGASEAGASTHGGSAGGSRLRGRAGREQRREQAAAEEAQGRGRRGRAWRRYGSGDGLPQLPDMAAEAAYSRRQRWMQEPPTSACPITPPDSPGQSDEEDCGGQASGSERRRGPDRQGDRKEAYLLRRQLKAFCSDPRQRTLVFPKSFSARDRYKLHVMAEGWGLMHASFGEGSRRRLAVWKPSRGRKSLKPSMLEGWASSGGDSSEGDGEGEEGDAAGSSVEQAADSSSCSAAAGAASMAAAAGPASQAD